MRPTPSPSSSTGLHWAALSLAGALTVLACRGGAEATPRPVLGAATPDRARSNPGDEHWVGVVVARDEIELTAAHDGRLAKVDVVVGERVAAGQRMAAIVAPEVEEQYLRTRAAVAAATSEVQRAVLRERYATETWDRHRRLRGLISAQELALAELDRDTAVEALTAAKVSRQELAAVLANTAAERQQLQIRAPAAAWVARIYLAEGASIAAGQAVLRLRSGGWLVRFAVPPEATPELSRRTQVVVRDGALEVFAHLAVIPSEVDSASGMTFVEADLPEAPWQHGQAVAVSLAPRSRAAT